MVISHFILGEEDEKSPIRECQNGVCLIQQLPSTKLGQCRIYYPVSEIAVLLLLCAFCSVYKIGSCFSHPCKKNTIRVKCRSEIGKKKFQTNKKKHCASITKASMHNAKEAKKAQATA